MTALCVQKSIGVIAREKGQIDYIYSAEYYVFLM